MDEAAYIESLIERWYCMRPKFRSLDERARYACKFRRLCDYFGEQLQEDTVHKFNEDFDGYDFVLENLRSHDCRILADKLKRMFPDLISDVQPYRPEAVESVATIDVVCKSAGSAFKLAGDSSFKDALDFFNYVKTFAAGNQIVLEPAYPKCVDTPFFRGKSGKLVHFTRHENLGGILENGIRIRANNDYRTFPKRIYLCSIADSVEKKVVARYVESILGLDVKPAAVQVDMNVLMNVKLYRDDTMEDFPGVMSMFTYTNIPAVALKDVSERFFG